MSYKRHTAESTRIELVNPLGRRLLGYKSSALTIQPTLRRASFKGHFCLYGYSLTKHRGVNDYLRISEFYFDGLGSLFCFFFFFFLIRISNFVFVVCVRPSIIFPFWH